ncbi:MAG: hypothetical protein ABS84_02715 [Rubrivivax sp. SCN 71-131]|nr:MAG: hypothetical protein ABS84_02715 [Rubrivivax sp. SCN 71-131]
MTSVRRALALSFGERYLLIMLALASNMLLARLLTPTEIGLYSVTLAVIGIAHVLRDFGVGAYLIQEKELTEAHVRTTFGISLAIGGTLFFALHLAAPWVARFYAEPEMAALMRTVALNFLVLPFCTVSLALLRRELEFKRLLYVNVVAAIVGFAVTVGLAWAGWGAFSMAVGAVATNASTGLGAWLVRRERRLLLPSFSEWRRVLGFSGQNVAANLVTTVSMDINDLAVGKILGFAPVAILSRAQGLMNLFHRDVMTAVRNVAFPAFARAHREGAAVDAHHTSSVTAVTACAWPFYGFVALFPLEILRLLFGDQWDSAVPLVPVFCLAGAIAVLANMVFPLIIAVGRIDLVTRAELLFQPARAALIVGAAVSYRSLMACALAYCAMWFIYVPLAYAVKQRCVRTHGRPLAAGCLRSAGVAAACLVPAALVSLQAGPGRDAPVSPALFAGAAAATIVAWVVLVSWSRHPLASEPLFVRTLGRFIPARRSPP